MHSVMVVNENLVCQFWKAIAIVAYKFPQSSWNFEELFIHEIIFLDLWNQGRW
jgi:hypothetical protein